MCHLNIILSDFPSITVVGLMMLLLFEVDFEMHNERGWIEI
jgi:hypothetical protein